jgi:hypothetical protein
VCGTPDCLLCLVTVSLFSLRIFQAFFFLLYSSKKVHWINLSRDRGSVAGSYEHGIKALGFLKDREFINYLSYYYKYYVSGHYSSSCFYVKHRSVYIPKHMVSETGLCLRLQVKPTYLGPIDRASSYLWKYRLALSIGRNWVGFTWRRMYNPVSETLCLKYK